VDERSSKHTAVLENPSAQSINECLTVNTQRFRVPVEPLKDAIACSLNPRKNTNKYNPEKDSFKGAGADLLNLKFIS
jgi:hypothetical protein